jgi:hypothetical protein
MFYRVILFIWDFVLTIAVSGMTDDEDVVILLLRQQLRIVERKQERDPDPTLAEDTVGGLGPAVETESASITGNVKERCGSQASDRHRPAS